MDGQDVWREDGASRLLPGPDSKLFPTILFAAIAMFPLWEHTHYMRIVAWKVLSAYAERHPETKAPLHRWRTLVKAANWTSMDDVRRAAPNAKVLNAERARFEIAGGNFRMIVAFDFGTPIAFIKFIGTHPEYDRIDALNVSLF